VSWYPTLAGVLATAMGIGLAVGVLYGRDQRATLPLSTERLLFLEEGRTADRLFLTFDSLAADVYWIRSIQHYGRDRRRPVNMPGRFELLEPLLDLTTTLDPYFNVAYRFGAIFLSLQPPDGPGRTDLGIALLEKGMAHNPDRWEYVYDIGFVHYWHTGDFEAAAAWFDRAAAMPESPEWLPSLAATTRLEGGDRAGARRLLTQLVESPERYIRLAAQRSLAQLQALDDIDLLESVVEESRARLGRYPSGWAELVDLGLLSDLPADATGELYVYDPDTHRVSLSPRSALGPLPGSFTRP